MTKKVNYYEMGQISLRWYNDKQLWRFMNTGQGNGYTGMWLSDGDMIRLKGLLDSYESDLLSRDDS